MPPSVTPFVVLLVMVPAIVMTIVVHVAAAKEAGAADDTKANHDRGLDDAQTNETQHGVLPDFLLLARHYVPSLSSTRRVPSRDHPCRSR